MSTPLQYRDIIDQIMSETTQFIDAKNLLELFPRRDVDNAVLERLIFRHLNDVAEASLSNALYDPKKTKLDSTIYSQYRYSSGLEFKLKFEDWNIIQKMGIMDSGITKIVAKPLKQATHYFFTGTELLDDGTRGLSPNPAQYNYIRDTGISNGTLARPLIITGATSGAWGTVANMIADINTLVGDYVAKGFDLANAICFYPINVHANMTKRRATSGDGFVTAIQELVNHGVNSASIFGIDPKYMYTAGGADPVATAFDILLIDRSQVRIYYTVPPFVNAFMDNSGTKFPEMTVETGLDYCPLFIPLYNVTDSKFYKGVSRITAISET